VKNRRRYDPGGESAAVLPHDGVLTAVDVFTIQEFLNIFPDSFLLLRNDDLQGIKPPVQVLLSVVEGFKCGSVGRGNFTLFIELKDSQWKEIDQFPVFFLAFPQRFFGLGLLDGQADLTCYQFQNVARIRRNLVECMGGHIQAADRPVPAADWNSGIRFNSFLYEDLSL